MRGEVTGMGKEETDEQRRAREAQEAAAAAEASGHTEEAKVYDALGNWVQNT